MYLCKEMVIMIPPQKRCNQLQYKKKQQTKNLFYIHVNKTNLTIYMNKFQHSTVIQFSYLIVSISLSMTLLSPVTLTNSSPH